MRKAPATQARKPSTLVSSVTLVRDLHAVFREIHQHGRRALEQGNYKAFGDAIAVERSLIQEQRDAVKALSDDIQKQQDLVATVPKSRTRRS